MKWEKVHGACWNTTVLGFRLLSLSRAKWDIIIINRRWRTRLAVAGAALFDSIWRSERTFNSYILAMENGGFGAISILEIILCKRKLEFLKRITAVCKSSRVFHRYLVFGSLLWKLNNFQRQ